MNKQKKQEIKNFLILLGITFIFLGILSLFIIIGEYLGLIQLYVGNTIMGLNPLDIWLILVICIFGPAIFSSLYLLYKFKILDV